MRRLTAYLLRMFAADALGLFGVTMVLLWLIQALRIFDVVSVKGQNVLTLLAQAALGMPPFAVIFMYVCAGIGIARALRAMAQSHELHIIHAGRRVGALVAATFLFGLFGALMVFVLANFVQPLANRQLSSWSASIAADLVGRSLVPNRFTQVAPNVIVVIGGRSPTGEITDFFANDRRDEAIQRTYFAKTAVVVQDDEGYVMQLHNGSVQSATASGGFSEIAFGTYNLALDQLTSDPGNGDYFGQSDTITLIRNDLTGGNWNQQSFDTVLPRLVEGPRVFAFCLLILAIAGFPSGKRFGLRLPLEIGILVVAFVERGFTAYVGGPFAPMAGPSLLLVAALLLLAFRLRPRRPGRPVLEPVPA